MAKTPQYRIEANKRWQQNNPDKVAAIVKRFHINHPERAAQISRRYRERDRKNARAIEHRYRRKYHTDPNIRLRTLLRSRLVLALRGSVRAARVSELIGCSIQECRAYLESKFKPGMTWTNQGTWHIDHIRPCASFDLSKPEQQRQCFHYTNLQPLWAKENQIKKDKIL